MDCKTNHCGNSFSVCLLGTAHDWRLRCGAVDLYFTLFGLSRPSCLPLPELGLVLNLKEKKAVLNPTIIPETGAGTQESASNAGCHAQLAGFQNLVSVTVVQKTEPHYVAPPEEDSVFFEPVSSLASGHCLFNPQLVFA